MRPDKLVYVTGTGTEVGKTWVSAALVGLLSGQDVRVEARKPVQSFDPSHDGPTDADLLARASGEAVDAVCRSDFSFAVPMAPPMAAGELGVRCPTIREVAEQCSFGRSAQVGLVEGVGGLFSPVGSDGDNRSLIEILDPDLVVVVADARLGTIHSTRACLAGLAGFDTMVMVNRFDPVNRLHDLNVAWLRAEGVRIAVQVSELAERIGYEA